MRINRLKEEENSAKLSENEMTIEELIELAEKIGFSHVGVLKIEALKPREDVRAMCAEDRCGRYGKNWCCPPGCGTLEEMEARMRRFSAGVLVQTTAELEDAFDAEGMQRAGKEHHEHFQKLMEELLSRGVTCLCMGAGSCSVCKECTYPEAPCRFPERAMPSMEASGLMVSDVCRESGVPYYYGKDTLTYTGCVLIE